MGPVPIRRKGRKRGLRLDQTADRLYRGARGVGTSLSGREPGGGLTRGCATTRRAWGCILWDSSVRGPSGRRTRFVLDLLLTKQVDIDDVPPMRSGALIM